MPTGRHALIAGNVWCGWALMATVAVYLRYFHPAGERGIERRAKWGVLLLAIAGLDILPNLITDAAYSLTGAGLIFPSSEWWNNPVTGFPHAVLWVAHHVASVIACFTGFLLLWRSRGRIPDAICAGLCFASAAGLSIYVTFTFALFLTPYAAVALWRRTWAERAAWAASGVTAIVCALPYLISLRDAGGTGAVVAGAGASGAASFVGLTVRPFTLPDVLLQIAGLSSSRIAWANLALLPLNYFLEMGLGFVLAILWWRRARRRKRLGQPETAALALFAVSFFVATFLRSTVIVNNDLAWRGAMIGQLILVIWSAGPLRAWWRLLSQRRGDSLVIFLVILGIASSVYEVAILRVYFPLVDAKKVPVVTWFSPDADSGRRTFDARVVYRQLSRSLPSDAVLQANPTHWSDIYHGLYGARQTAAFDSSCGSVFGGNPANCESMQSQLAPLFQADGDVDRECDAWGISVLIAKDDDLVFRDHTAWPWTRAPLAATERVRAIPCGH